MKLAALLCTLALPAAALAGEVSDAASNSSEAARSVELEPDAMLPGYRAPARQWRSIEHAQSAQECRDRIHAVREERGLPGLDREPADPANPLMIWAVDRREAGCSVLVIKDNPEDIRPLPAPSKGPHFRLIPSQ